jgi:hypothetical protein
MHNRTEPAATIAATTSSTITEPSAAKSTSATEPSAYTVV